MNDPDLKINEGQKNQIDIRLEGSVFSLKKEGSA